MSVAGLVHRSDVQRLLRSPVVQRSAHFAVHHVADGHKSDPSQIGSCTQSKLSTAHAMHGASHVDNLSTDLSSGPRLRSQLACVVPKRYARRAVTRNVLKRQMRAALGRNSGRLPCGLWLLRLRRPFVQAQFPSADSTALRGAARIELDELLARVAVL